MCGRACHCIHLAHLHEWDFSIPPLPVFSVVVVLRSPIHANEPSEYNGMLYRSSNRVLNNGIKVIILICMDGTSQYHHHRFFDVYFIDWPKGVGFCYLDLKFLVLFNTSSNNFKKEVRENSDLNKTLHLRVALLVGNCKKLFLVLNNWLIGTEL